MYDMIFCVWFLYIHATIIIMAPYRIDLLLGLTLPLCPTAYTKLPGTTRKRKRSRKQQQATTVANTRTASSVSSAMPPAASLSPAAKVKRVHTAYTLFLHGTLRIVFESGSRPVSDVCWGCNIFYIICFFRDILNACLSFSSFFFFCDFLGPIFTDLHTTK